MRDDADDIFGFLITIVGAVLVIAWLLIYAWPVKAKPCECPCTIEVVR